MPTQIILRITLEEHGYFVRCGNTIVGHAHSLKAAIKEADIAGLVLATHNRCKDLIIEIEECLWEFLPKNDRFWDCQPTV